MAAKMADIGRLGSFKAAHAERIYRKIDKEKTPDCFLSHKYFSRVTYGDAFIDIITLVRNITYESIIASASPHQWCRKEAIIR